MPFQKPFCLALSGGGTKGLAHAGVLQFLDEQKITIDKISGTSAGSIVGGLYAAGKRPEEILEFFKSVPLFSWKHFTISKPGIIDSKAFKHYFKNFIGNDILIGETNIPIYITATDLVSGNLKIFNKDEKLIDAILASSSVPGVFSPVKIGDNLYADGAILNNFPTDLLQTDCNYLLGVYVSPLQELSVKQISTIRAVTSRSFELLAVKEMILKRKYCDEIIEPKALSKYNTFETNAKKMDEIFEIGYQEAKKVLTPVI
jgi:NTE family protein